MLPGTSTGTTIASLLLYDKNNANTQGILPAETNAGFCPVPAAAAGFPGRHDSAAVEIVTVLKQYAMISTIVLLIAAAICFAIFFKSINWFDKI